MSNGLLPAHSKMLYGIAILMMLFHHLPLDIVNTSDVDNILGQGTLYNLTAMGKMCVAIYAFITGYAMYKHFSLDLNANYKTVARQLTQFIPRYWLSLAFVVGVGYACCSWHPTTGVLLNAIVGYQPEQVLGSLWYVQFYATMLVFLPLLHATFMRHSEISHRGG